MTRIVHTGDWHYGIRATNVTRDGFNQRELDVYRAGATITDYICEHIKPDIVCIVGDVYQGTRPDTLAITSMFSAVQKFNEHKIEVVILGGNHDTPARPGRESPLAPLGRFFKAHLFLEQASEEIGGIAFHALPYRTLSTGTTEPFKYSQTLPNVLLAHATVDSPLLPAGMLMDLVKVPEEQCDAPEISVALLGHIHIHKRVTEKGYYCGSIERLNFGELTHMPAIWVHDVAEDGSVSTESVRVVDMGEPMTPRPVTDIVVDGDDKTLEEIASEVNANLSLDCTEHLMRLTVNKAPRALRSSGLPEEWRRKAYGKSKCFYLEIRIRSRELGEFFGTEEAAATATEEALRIEPEWKVFLEEKKRLDLLEEGLQMIREARGD